jgi:phosphatidylserine decarboxylase
MSRVGWLFITPNLLLSGLAVGYRFYPWAILFGVFGLFMAFFFRDPERTAPEEKNCIVSPADGKVVFQGRVYEPISKKKMEKVSIFMSLFDVHVNRVPFDGKVKKIEYKKGRFLPAYKEEAGTFNESNTIFFSTPKGEPFIVTQIAGILARRIVCSLKPGQPAIKGERFGIICFGSKVDLYLPESVSLESLLGKKVKAGKTILGYWS